MRDDGRGNAARWRRYGLMVMLGLGLAGCVSFSHLGSPFEPLLATQRYDEALKALESGRINGRDRVLYELDKGMLLRLKGDLVASNAALEQAKRGMEQLASVSVTEQFTSTTVNDTLRKYGGASFERVLAHVYKALNFLELGRPDEARVEALQLDVLLKELNSPPGTAFARYVSGLVFDAGRDWNDAMVAYRKAYEAYQRDGLAVPVPLKQDLLRLTRRQGLHDEYRQFAERFGMEASPDDETGKGTVVFVLHSGLIPRKQEQSILVQSPSSGLMTRVATPFYETRWPAVTGARLQVGELQVEGAQVADLGAMARRSLEQEMPGVIARAVARAAIKNVASRSAGKNQEAVGILVNVIGVLTERADLRGWYTLPQTIAVARVRLPPGQYPVAVALFGGGGGARVFPPVSVVAGESSVISLHWPVTGGVSQNRGVEPSRRLHVYP